MTAPWHDAPACPHCSLPVVSPAAHSGRHGETTSDHLWCPACGADWRSDDVAVVAQAWWSQGAQDAREYWEAAADATRLQAGVQGERAPPTSLR